MNALLPSTRLGINAVSSGPTVWTPALISPQVWLDPSDPATLYDATSGGALVTTHGAQVKRIEDKSGNGFHAVESFNPPRLSTAANSRTNCQMLAFNKNETTRLREYSATFDLANICVAFVVWELMPVDYAGILSIGSSGAGNDYDATNRAEFDTAYNSLNLAGSFGSHGLPLQYGTKCGALSCYVINQYSGTQKIYRNGVLTTTTAVAASGTSAAGFLIGSRWVSGAVSTNYLNGQLGEIIVSAGLNPANVAALNAYLLAKYVTAADALPSLYGTPEIAFCPDSNKNVFNRYCLAAGHREGIAAMFDVTGHGHNAFQTNNTYIPTFFKYTGRKYLAMRAGHPPDSFGTYTRCYFTDDTGLTFNGETTLEAEFSLHTNWADGAVYKCIASRINAGHGTSTARWAWWVLPDGKLRLDICYGTSYITIASSAAGGFVAGQKVFARAQWIPDTGSGQYAILFFTSLDGTTWTQLGTTLTGTTVTMNNSSPQLIEIGSLTTGDRSNFAGMDFYSFKMWNGSPAGTLVLDWRADDATHWSASSADRISGRTFSHGHFSKGLWALIGKSCYYTASHYLDLANEFNTALNFTGAFYVMQTSGNVWGFTTNSNVGPPHVPLKYGASLYSYGSNTGSGYAAPALIDPSTCVGRVTANTGAGDTTTNGITNTNDRDIAFGTYLKMNRLNRRGFVGGEDTPSAWFSRQVFYNTVETPASVETWLKA